VSFLSMFTQLKTNLLHIMKKFNLTILTIAVSLLSSIEQINARPFLEGDAEISKYFSYKTQTDISITYTGNLTDNSLDLILTGKTHFTNYNTEIEYFQNIDKVEFETEMDIEEWMLDIKDDCWKIDPEEPLILEYWMLDPCDWLCQD